MNDKELLRKIESDLKYEFFRAKSGVEKATGKPSLVVLIRLIFINKVETTLEIVKRICARMYEEFEKLGKKLIAELGEVA
ncbi:MAG: hypothetical protein ACK5MW_04935 [Enterococcus sp.]